MQMARAVAGGRRQATELLRGHTLTTTQLPDGTWYRRGLSLDGVRVRVEAGEVGTRWFPGWGSGLSDQATAVRRPL
jgi:hypothetical protein